MHPNRSAGSTTLQGKVFLGNTGLYEAGGPGWVFAFQDAQWQRVGAEKLGAIPFGCLVGQDSAETEKMEGLMSWLKGNSFSESRNFRHHLNVTEYMLYCLNFIIVLIKSALFLSPREE